MALLEVRHLKKTYTNRFGTNQVEALKDVTFSMEEGEYTAVMGESGSGKTTLLNLLASFDRPTSGDIILNGLPFRKIQDKDLAVYRRKNLGFVFQDFNLLDTLSVRDNIFLLFACWEKTEEMKKRLSPSCQGASDLRSAGQISVRNFRGSKTTDGDRKSTHYRTQAHSGG